MYVVGSVRCLFETGMRLVCGLWAVCMGVICGLYAACVRLVCGLYAACMRPVCVLCAAFTRHVCGMYWPLYISLSARDASLSPTPPSVSKNNNHPAPLLPILTSPA